MRFQRYITIGIVLILTLIGCVPQSAAPLPTPTDAPSSPTVTHTPDPTATPEPPTVTPQPTAVAIACVPRSDWLTYVVTQGDTLSNLASRVNSSVNQLVNANCLLNANNIRVGQKLYVPVLPAPDSQPLPPVQTLPVIDIAVPTNVCAVESIGSQANVYIPEQGQSPAAILKGKAPLVRTADNTYIINIPGIGKEGWISALEARLTGANCPFNNVPSEPVEPTWPIVGISTPPQTGCWVGSNEASAPVYGPGDSANPVAMLVGYVEYISTNNNSYEVVLPGFTYNGSVHTSDTHLSSGCSNLSPELPVYGIPGLPPADGCFVLPNKSNVSVFFGPADAFAPIASLGDYANFVNVVMDGYEISTPGFDFNGWVNASDVRLVGNTCP